jgi:hypothetical protein
VFPLRFNTTLQLARVFEGIKRNFDEILSSAVFLDMAKAFDTLCVDGFLY